MKTNIRLLLRVQGLYFLLLGVLPLFTSDNFLQSITLFGPQWLVRLSTGIMLSVGSALIVQSFTHKPKSGTLTLGVMASIVLFAIDLSVEFSTLNMTMHIGDAFAQALFIGFGSTVLLRSGIPSRR